MSSNIDESFSFSEKKNMALYIVGIMFWKFAYETLSQAISLIAQAKFDKSIALTMTPVLSSTFNIMQCICSIGAAQFLVRFKTNVILASIMFAWGLLALILIIVDASTGGSLRDGKFTEGRWPAWLLFVTYLPMGGCLGILELIRRVIPRDIVGENPNKLRRMDAMVHIFYEVAGTSGALTSAETMKRWGPVYAMMLMPIFFTCAGIVWLLIRQASDAPSDYNRNKDKKPAERRNFFYLFFYSIKRGAQIVFTERRFIWLIPGYVIPFVFHRFIENVIFPTFTRQVLNNGPLSGILLGGSNLGELLGALMVLVVAHRIPTPLPWVRYDALALMVLWIFPYMPGTENAVRWVWTAFPLMVFLSAGWAAGDVSLVAYIQSRIHTIDLKETEGTSPLGCVMSFLYSSYIVIFLVLSIPLGRVFDAYRGMGRIRESFIYISGVMMLVGAVLIFACTFVPKGSFAINPDIDESDKVASNEDEVKDEKSAAAMVEAISMG